MENLKNEDLIKMLSNPFYCINIHPGMSLSHKPIITEEIWKKAAKNLINEIGPEKFLDSLLNNLKGGDNK